MVQVLLPLGTDTSIELTIYLLTQQVIFWLSYFSFWRDLVFAILSLIPFIVCCFTLHLESTSRVLVYLVQLPWHILSLFVIHWVISKVGLLYVDAKLYRKGNKKLLDNLDEGIMILDQNSMEILYCNKAMASS